MATRYSWFLTSRGMPTFTATSPSSGGGARRRCRCPRSVVKGTGPGLGCLGPRLGRGRGMKLYADRPTRVLGQLAGDLVVVILVFLAVRLGRGTHDKVA